MTATISARNSIAEAIHAEQTMLTNLMKGINDTDWVNRTRNDGWTIHDVVGHIADSLFGMNMLVLDQLPPGAIDMDQLNAYRRQQNLPLSRAEVEAKLDAGFATLLETVGSLPDLTTPGLFGQTLGDWLATVPPHLAEHREEVQGAIKA